MIPGLSPKKYTVESETVLVDELFLNKNGMVDYSLHGPNGFVRSWVGNATALAGAVQVGVTYNINNDSISFTISRYESIHCGDCGNGFVITDNIYNLGGPWLINNNMPFVSIPLAKSGNWYDFNISC